MGERVSFSEIESHPLWETTTPQGQMDAVQQWEISNTEWLRDNALGVPLYTQAANKFARGAQEIRQSIINRHARETLSVLPTVDERNQVIDAWKSGNVDHLSEAQLGTLKTLRSFSQENAPLARDYGGLAITPSGPAAMGTPLSKNSEKFMTGTLKRRADSQFEYFMPSPDIDDNHKTMVLDGNVNDAVKSMDARVQQLKKIEKDAEAKLKDFKPQGMGDAGSVSGLVAQANTAKKEREELENKLERYGANNGQIEYVLDQINERVRKAPYIGAMGEGASFETLGGQLDRATIDTLGNITSGLAIGAAALGELESRAAGAIGLEGAAETLGRGAERARTIAKDVESVTTPMKEGLPQMSRLQFRDTFASKVGLGVVNNAPGFVLDMVLSGGSSVALRKGISAAAKRSVAVMQRAGKLKYVDNVFAPMLGTMPGALREGTDTWMEGMQKVEETLGDYESIEAARMDAERLSEAGDSAGAANATAIADRAQKLMDGANFAFLGAIASTSGTDFIPLQKMLKMGNRTAGDMADELINRVAKDGPGIKDALSKATQQAFLEGTTESIQGVINRNWANQFYEANKELFGEDIGVEAAVGAIMGFTAGGAIESVGLRKLQHLNRQREEKRVAELKDIEEIERARNEIVETEDGKFTTKDENFTEEFLTREEAEAFAQTRFRERFFDEARQAFKERGHSDEKIDKMERTLRVLTAKAAQRAGESEDAFFEHVTLKDLGVDPTVPPPAPEPEAGEPGADFDFENDPDLQRDPLAIRTDEVTGEEAIPDTDAEPVDVEKVAKSVGLKPKQIKAIKDTVKAFEKDEGNIIDIQANLENSGLTKKQTRAILETRSLEAAVDAAINNKAELARRKEELGAPNLVRLIDPEFDLGVEPLPTDFNLQEFNNSGDLKLGAFYQHVAKTHGTLLKRLEELGVKIAIGSGPSDFRAKLGVGGSGPDAIGWATTGFDGRPIIGIANKVIERIQRLKGDAEAMTQLKQTLEHEAVHAAEFIFSKRHPKLFKEAKKIFNKRSKEYDADFDAFMTKEYPSWSSRTLESKTHEGIRAVVEGRWTGKTTGNAHGWHRYVSEFINFVRGMFGNGEIRHDSIVALARGTEKVLGVREGAFLKDIDADALLNPEVTDPIILTDNETTIPTREESEADPDAEPEDGAPEPSQAFEQEGLSGNRARVERFADTQEVLITLMQDADLSTFANTLFGALGLVKNSHGVSFLDAALGGRRDKFLEWAESAGKADETVDTEQDEKKQKPSPTSFGQLSEAGMQKAATGFEQFIKTGKSPVAGLDTEFEVLGEMMEELYRGTADAAGIDLTDEAMFPFNSLFLDDNQRQEVGELMQGEVPANLPGYVRVATKKGQPQKGFKELYQVEAFRNRQKTPEGRRMKVEHEDGRFYLIQPITTPAVQRAQNIVERANRGDTVNVKRNEQGQKIQRLPSKEAIATTASRANGFMGIDLVQNFVGKLPLIGATWKRAETAILQAVQRWQETTYAAKSIANAEASLMKEMPAQYDPRTEEIVDVIPLAGGSRHWHDVFSSIARGEDNYIISDELRDYIYDYRNKIKDIVRMMHEEGIDLEWLQRNQEGDIDWANSGIPGYIPRVTKPDKDRTKKQDKAIKLMERRIAEGRGDQELTAQERKAVRVIEAMNQGEGLLFGPPTKAPKTTRGFERARKFRGSQGGQDAFDAGYRHPDPVDSMAHFLRDTYQRVADHRFFVDEGAVDKIIDATKSLEFSHSNQGRVAKAGGYKILFDTKKEQEEFSKVFDRNYNAPEDGKIMRITQFGKGILAGLDFSTGFIFGHIEMMANPDAWIKAVGKQFESFFNEDAFINLVSQPDKQMTYKDSARLGVQYGHQAEYTKGLEGQFFNRATLGLSGRFAHGHKGFLDASSFYLWESMTMHMPRDANGNITAAFETEARAIADFINRATGKNDFARYGAKQRHITVGRALMFAPQMYAGFTNLYLSMASSGTEGKLARRAMGKFVLGITTGYISMALAAGLDWDEIKDRLNPTSGAFLTLPFEHQNGTIKEIGLGGFTRSIMKMIGQSTGAVMGLLDVGPDELKNDRDVIDPFIEFMRARVAPGISTSLNLIRGKNYFGEPVPPEENLINGFLPIWSQDWAKWKTRNIYDALSERSGSSSYWHEHRIYLPDDPTTATTVEDAVTQFLGLNAYSQSRSRNFRTRMERMSREKFDMEYEDLNPAQMVEINREINEMPMFQDDSKSTLENKEKRNRAIGNTAEQMEKNKASVRRMMSGDNLKKISDLGVSIPAVDMVMTYRGEQYVLSIKQIKELREAYAREFDDAIRKTEMIPRWKEYSPEFRKEQMQKALNQASKRARRFIDKPVDGE